MIEPSKWAWAQNLPHGEKIVLLALADFADDQDWKCWPSIGLLTKMCGIGRRGIQLKLSALKEKNLIEIFPRNLSSNIYLLKGGGMIYGSPPHDPGITPPMIQGSPPHDPGIAPPMIQGSPPHDPGIMGGAIYGSHDPPYDPPYDPLYDPSCDPKDRKLVKDYVGRSTNHNDEDSGTTTNRRKEEENRIARARARARAAAHQ